jgi:hypothetical protein
VAKNFGALATLSFSATPTVALKLNPSKYSGEMNSDLTARGLHPLDPYFSEIYNFKGSPKNIVKSHML